MPTQNPKKYLDEEGLETVLELLKDTIDNVEFESIEDEEVAELFEIDELDQRYVSQEALNRALNEEEY